MSTERPTDDTKAQAAVEAFRAMSRTRLGMPGYLCIWAYLQARPCTSAEIALQFCTSEQTMREIVNRMGELGMAHTVGGISRTGKGPLLPIWAGGPGRVKRTGTKVRDNMPQLMQVSVLLRLLQEPISRAELIAQSGSGINTMAMFLPLAKRLGLVHIDHWERTEKPQGGGSPAAHFVLGAGRDAPRPKPIPLAVLQRNRDIRARARKQALKVLNALAGRAAPQQLVAA